MFTVEMGDQARVGLRRFTRAEYDRLVELGWFRDEKLELLHGLLVPGSPQEISHAYVIQQLNRILMRALGDRAVIRIQMPFVAVILVFDPSCERSFDAELLLIPAPWIALGLPAALLARARLPPWRRSPRFAPAAISLLVVLGLIFFRFAR